MIVTVCSLVSEIRAETSVSVVKRRRRIRDRMTV
eukprot:IDg6026t1